MKKKILTCFLVITLTFSNIMTILAEGTVESDDLSESVCSENADTFVEDASDDFLETEDESVLPNGESTEINEMPIQSLEYVVENNNLMDTNDISIGTIID